MDHNKFEIWRILVKQYDSEISDCNGQRSVSFCDSRQSSSSGFSKEEVPQRPNHVNIPVREDIKYWVGEAGATQ